MFGRVNADAGDVGFMMKVNVRGEYNYRPGLVEDEMWTC